MRYLKWATAAAVALVLGLFLAVPRVPAAAVPIDHGVVIPAPASAQIVTAGMAIVAIDPAAGGQTTAMCTGFSVTTSSALGQALAKTDGPMTSFGVALCDTNPHVTPAEIASAESVTDSTCSTAPSASLSAAHARGSTVAGYADHPDASAQTIPF